MSVPLSRNKQEFAAVAIGELGTYVKRLNRIGRRNFGLSKDNIKLVLLTMFEILGDKSEISHKFLLSELRKHG